MDYKIDDILYCTEIFSNNQLVFCESDTFKIVDIDFDLYLKQIAIKDNYAIYNCVVKISPIDADGYFKCIRVDRKRKLDEIGKRR